MILGVGVDIVKIARFESITQSFAARVFTPDERAFLSAKGPASAAGLFAAKEAVAKALGTGFSGFWPDSIEIVHNKKGRPYVVLHNEAAKITQDLTGGDYSIMLSISHTNTDAVAFAILIQQKNIHPE
ncbi:MAG: holo-ACP synthase [Defluviitaleaceae bacterium]|nr:holo-ACP synthase [Defluviitaleaceae bacterium]